MSASSDPSSSVRRSSRLQAKAAPIYIDPLSDDEDSQAPSAEPSTPVLEYKPPAKRARKRASGASAGDPSSRSLGPRGRRRVLSKLVDMPLDILYEIFGHLHPYDLVQLSRTTRALRDVLMRRSAITIWRNACRGVEDLPECPPDLTEPAYANLLFDHHCHFCLKARVMTVLWNCRVRACKPCLKEHFTPLFDVLVAASAYLPPGPQQLIKTSSMVPMEFLNNKLLIPNTKMYELLGRIAGCKGDETALKDLEKECTEAVKRLKDSALRLTEWQIKQNNKRTMDLLDLRLRRRKQIVERLCQLGYGEDLKWMTYERVDYFIEHPLVKQAKELTDRIWNNIKDHMIAFAEEARTERLMRERCAHYVNRLSVVRDTVVRFLARRPLNEALPSVADFSYYTPGFRYMLNTHRDTFFQSLEMPQAELDAILGEAVRGWHRSMAQLLYGMIVAATGEGPSAGGPPHADSPSPTEVGNRICAARTWFRCTNPACGALLDYPRVLAHSCAHAAPEVDMHPATDRADLENAYALVLEETPWNFSGDRVVYDPVAQAAAETVLRVCGRDPANTPAWVMTRKRMRFVCSLCSRDGQRCVMAWPRAVAHLAEHRRAGQEPKVTKLSKRDTRAVLDLEAVRLFPFFTSTYKMWGCVRCRVRPPMTLVEVFDHCSDEHLVDVPEEDEDYSMHADAETDRGVPAHDMYYDASLFLTPIRR